MSPVAQSVEHWPSDQLPEGGVGSSPSMGTNILQKDFFRFHQNTKKLQNGRHNFPVTSFFTDFSYLLCPLSLYILYMVPFGLSELLDTQMSLWPGLITLCI